MSQQKIGDQNILHDASPNEHWKYRLQGYGHCKTYARMLQT